MISQIDDWFIDLRNINIVFKKKKKKTDDFDAQQKCVVEAVTLNHVE